MTFNGLPLHPLVVHLTVVLLPVTVLVTLASLHPRWRNRLRLPAVLLAAVAFLLVWLTASSGESLQSKLGLPMQGLMKQHADYADRLKVVSFALAALAGLRFFAYDRPGWVRWVSGALVAIAAVGVAVLTYQVGDAGARLVYGN